MRTGDGRRFVFELNQKGGMNKACGMTALKEASVCYLGFGK
jgi:hypothetical protein